MTPTVFPANRLSLVQYSYDHLKQTNTFAYYTSGQLGAGRPSVMTSADGMTKRYAYDGFGKTVHEWGSAAYPVEYQYDSTYLRSRQGRCAGPTRMKLLVTERGRF